MPQRSGSPTPSPICEVAATVTRLNSLTWGDDPRQLLLLHGLGASAQGWWRVGPELAARGWSVTAPDFRGHGASPDAERYALADHAADVLALRDRWDAVLGHSMGGAVAVISQTQSPHWAGRLVLQEPAIVIPGPPEDTINWLLEDHRRPLTPAQLAIHYPGWQERDCEAKAAAVRRTGPDVITATILDSWPWNVFDQLCSVTVPTAILGSDPMAGGIFPVALGRWLAETSASIDYTTIPRASHSAHRDGAVFEDYIAAVVMALDGAPTLPAVMKEDS